ncbi:hypothetical protein [Thiohalobacter sp. IOR34]
MGACGAAGAVGATRLPPLVIAEWRSRWKVRGSLAISSLPSPSTTRARST